MVGHTKNRGQTLGLRQPLSPPDLVESSRSSILEVLFVDAHDETYSFLGLG